MNRMIDLHKVYLFALVEFLFLSNILHAQTWTQKANFGGGIRQYSTYFAAGGKGYIGFGNNTQVNDLWEFEPANNTWTKKDSIPGSTGRAEMIAFVIGNKAYCGLGLLTSTGVSNEFWEFDPATGHWTQVATYPGTWTRGPSVFSIGTKGYVCSGSTYNEMWEYESTNNTWTRKNDIPPAAQRYYGVGFAVGNKGYMGTGVVGSTSQRDFWEYDPANDSWTRKADVGGGNRVNAVSFNSTTRGYIATGAGNDVWEYNPGNNTWTQKPNYPGTGAFAGAGFAIGCNIYIGVGYGAQDFWELTVCASLPLSASVSSTNDSCYGGNKGKATANPTGGTPPYTYFWQPDGQTTSSITGLRAGNYKLIVTDGAQNKDSISFTITQPAPVDIDASTDTTICSGNPVSLSASGGVSYAWHPGTDLTDSTRSMVTATPSISTPYVVTAWDLSGCSGMDTVVVTVNTVSPLPDITATDTTICSGDSTQVCASGNFTSYLWNTGSANSCSTAKGAGGYWVTVTDANGCSAVSEHQEIDVHPVPSISIVVQGDTLSSFNAVSYQWYQDGNLIPGATAAVYIATESGDYALEITDANGCRSISNPVYVDISTDIEDHQESSGFLLYPNPASSEVFLIQNRNIGEVRFINMLGQQVKREMISSGSDKTKIDISALPSGVYSLMFYSDRQLVGSKLLVHERK